MQSKEFTWNDCNWCRRMNSNIWARVLHIDSHHRVTSAYKWWRRQEFKSHWHKAKRSDSDDGNKSFKQKTQRIEQAITMWCELTVFFRSSWFVCDNYRLADECKDHERYKYTHSDAFCMCVWHECNIQIDILSLSWRRTKNLNSGRRLQRDSEMSSLVITITCT